MLSLQASTTIEIAIDLMSHNVSLIVTSVVRVFKNVFMVIRKDVVGGVVATDT